MNLRQYTAASKLSQDQLMHDRGAFFKSVFGTLNHILVGDIIWLSRFAMHPSCVVPLSSIRDMDKPESLDTILFSDFTRLTAARMRIDDVLVDWVEGLTEEDINGCLTYTNMAGRSFNKPFASLINHLFLHQVHHRGQVTTLLSQYGIDFGETDLVELINDCEI